MRHVLLGIVVAALALSQSTRLSNITVEPTATVSGLGQSHLNDCRVSISASVLTVPTPCRLRMGEAFSTVAGNATATLSGTVASGDVFVYFSSSGTLTAAQNTAATLTCNANCSAVGTTGFPLGSTPIAQAAFVSNSYTAVTDLRAAFSNKNTVCGTGMICTHSTGQVEAAADTTVMLRQSTAQAGTPWYCRSTTGNDTYTCSLTPAIASYTRGACVVLDADTANTGAATLNVNGVGAASILKRDASALADGDVTANRPKIVCNDATNWIIQGDGGGGGSTGWTLLDRQRALSAVTVTTSETVLFTYAVDSIAAGGCVAVRAVVSIPDQAANLQLKLQYSTLSLNSQLFDVGAGGGGHNRYVTAELCNGAGVQNAQTLAGVFQHPHTGGGNLFAGAATPYFVDGTISTTGSQTLRLVGQMGSGSVDVTPRFWSVSRSH